MLKNEKSRLTENIFIIMPTEDILFWLFLIGQKNIPRKNRGIFFISRTRVYKNIIIDKFNSLSMPAILFQEKVPVLFLNNLQGYLPQCTLLLRPAFR